ncbi:MAG: hypothetical protein JRC93_11165 [Deltaproteobacteria bacterium]|nr:hypothetical protein [Deltaproteobacteria bacterium]
MDVARAWLDGNGKSLPIEVEAALSANQYFGATKSWIAEPEAKLKFDSFAGEPRNSDLAVHIKNKNGNCLLAVEAKADEPFGETIEKTIKAAEVRLAQNPRSNGLSRVRQLKEAILGNKAKDEVLDTIIRYQLLTACAGALCEAERSGYSRALMLVHEFFTDKTNDIKHRRNGADLNTFVLHISDERISKVEFGLIYGPFRVFGLPIIKNKIDLFVGKVSRNIRTGG